MDASYTNDGKVLTWKKKKAYFEDSRSIRTKFV